MEKKAGILSVREIVAYSLGLAGVQVLVSYMNSYQAQFYKATMGADLAFVGFILLAAKVISAFIDPFIGQMIDKSHFKMGKLKPFVLIGLVAFSILTVAIFIAVPLHGFAMYAYIFVMFLLWSVAMTLTDIPTQGMLSVMSPDIGDRNKTAGVANVIKGGGFVACFVIVPAVCMLLKTGDNPMGQKEYIVSTLFMVVLAFALIMLLFFNVKERVVYNNSTVTTKEMFHMVKDNKPLMLVFLSQIFGFGRGMSATIQVQAAAALIGTVSLTDKIMITGENAGLIMGMGCAISTTICGCLMPLINKKWGEKKTFIVFAIYGFVVCTASFILYISGVTSIWSLLICLFVVGFMYGPHSFLPLVMVPDCIDYYELKTGKRTDGIHFAVLSLANKLGAALCVAGGLIIVGISGYAPGCEITQRMRDIIYAAYVLVPGISCITAMLPILGYKLVGKEKQRIADELAVIHAQENRQEIIR
jgi:Na+/melibiose symporter-like transporter